MADKSRKNEFERLNLEFKNLWGRNLQLIDCQNIFCEVDKYSRVAHPELTGYSHRTRIKSRNLQSKKRLRLNIFSRQNGALIILFKNYHGRTTKNIFISHYAKDDEHVQSLKERLKDQGYDVRNFSVDSTNHKDGRKPSKEVIARLLTMRIKWSRAFICLIGPKTHTREWVDFEIEEAKQQGKTIIGVYTHGSMETAEIPEKLKKYASNIIGWNSIEKLGEMISEERIFHLKIQIVP